MLNFKKNNLITGCKNPFKSNIMTTYIIIDRLGMRHATIKASTNFEATEKYLGKDAIKSAFTNVFAIAEVDLKLFKKQIKNL